MNLAGFRPEGNRGVECQIGSVGLHIIFYDFRLPCNVRIEPEDVEDCAAVRGGIEHPCNPSDV